MKPGDEWHSKSASSLGLKTRAPFLRFHSGRCRRQQQQHLLLYLLTCFTSLEPDAFIWACSVLRVSRHLHYLWLSYTHGKSLPAGSDVCSPFSSPSILLIHHFRYCYTTCLMFSHSVCLFVCVVGFRLINCLFCFVFFILKKHSVCRVIIIRVPGDGWLSHIKAQISQGSQNHLRWIICTTAVEDNECNMAVAPNPPYPGTTVTQTKTQQYLDDISF